MLSTLKLIQLFPYSSRRIAPPLADYASFQARNGLSADSTVYEDFNFIEGDGLSTEIIVNDPNEKANYVLVTQNGAVVSRWFILEKARTTNYSAKQCRLSLKRDVLADYKTTWESAPAFISKGRITDPQSPFLFNHENMTFNQVKTGEYELPDETGMQWVVGYIARNAALTSSSAAIGGPAITLSSEDKPLPNAISFATVSAFEKAFGAETGEISFIWDAKLLVNLMMFIDKQPSHPLDIDDINRQFSKSLSGYGVRGLSGYQHPPKHITFSHDLTEAERAKALLSNVDLFLLAEAAGFPNPALASSAGTNLVGKTVYIDALKKNFRVVLDAGQSQNPIFAAVPEKGTQLFREIEKEIPDSGSNYTSSGYWGTGDFTLRLSVLKATLRLEEIPSGEYQISLLDAGLRPHLDDAPYDMFCIPYSDTATVETSKGSLQCSKALAWTMAVLLATSLSSGDYDLQLLPYCPAREAIEFKSSDEARVNCSEMATDFVYKGKGSWDAGGSCKAFERGTAVLPVIWCKSSTFSFRIKSPLPLQDTEYPASAQRVKELNETRRLRLVSPNLAGGFDFSPMMNGGVAYFRADCTYKPFNPYIHVSPEFKFLYGADFGDARGLVCGGDFSLPRIESAWATYQLQNKNYQAIFDRGIENLEVTQKHQRIEEGFGIVSGTFQGAASGAYMGGQIVPGIGAGVGAAVGAAVSLAGGIADAVSNNALRAEAIDYRKDLFGYQLGNVKALPYSLAKTAAFNANNRPFPFVETYDCTDAELKALRAKIQYNGMTVGAVGIPSNYFRPRAHDWIQCFPAGAPNEWPGVTSMDWTAIAEELSKGAFIYEEASS